MSLLLGIFSFLSFCSVVCTVVPSGDFVADWMAMPGNLMVGDEDLGRNCKEDGVPGLEKSSFVEALRRPLP